MEAYCTFCRFAHESIGPCVPLDHFQARRTKVGDQSLDVPCLSEIRNLGDATGNLSRPLQSMPLREGSF